MKRSRPLLPTAILLIAASWASAASNAPAPVFEKDILPILENSTCLDCHNPEKRKGRLDLTTPGGLIKGGESGPAFKAGKPARSILYEMIHSGEMPQKGDQLTEKEIHTIEHWIETGATFLNPPAPVAATLNQHDIYPITLLRCTACHGPQLKRANLDLRTRAGMLKGGDNGPALVPGDPDASPMIRRIEQKLCPTPTELLKYFVRIPTDEEVDKLRTWIAQGAPEEDIAPDVASTEPDPLIEEEDRQHWSFRPLQPVPVPNQISAQKSEIRNPVDIFIHQKLSENNLAPSEEASRLDLVRRAHFDLLGLPPTLAQLERWQDAPGPGWFDAMLDELLDSPHYGERWGRYWLDVAGYSSSEGGQTADNIREVAWKYRDYVIRSFNADKPYNRFLVEQIAGDELIPHDDPGQVTDEVVDNLTATGFLRMGIDQTASRTMNFVPERIGVISDAINVLGSGVLGLTMECARCHSHKYDPIPQRDYYRLKAVFQGAFDEHDWLSWKTRTLEVATPAMAKSFKANQDTVAREVANLESRRKKAIATLQQGYYDKRFPTIPEKLQAEVTAALKIKDGRFTARQADLREEYTTWLRPTEEMLAEMHQDFADELNNIDARLAELRPKVMPPLTIRALWDRGEPSPTYFLVRGEHNRPGRLIGPGIPSVLTDGKTPFEVAPPWPGAKTTGRRLAFAKWLASPDNPLTARVIVNRVWSHHFGRGIVATLDNFGVQGARPTHPELLDWLSKDFVDHGWSIKHLHRRIMTSETWRRSSAVTTENLAADPENIWLARMSLRRLNAEALRDALLHVSGELDPTMYGPAIPVTVRDDGLTMAEASTDGWRRSIYLRYRRTEMPSLLSAFDYPQMQPNCVQRSVSTVSPQALMLSNNHHVYELSHALAERVRKLAGEDLAQSVETIYRLALSRPPAADETRLGVASLEKLEKAWANPESAARQALATYAHTLLNSAEFIYVD